MLQLCPRRLALAWVFASFVTQSVALSIPALSTLDPRSLYPSVKREGDAKPSALFGSTDKPKPTNAWWTNLIMASPGSMESNIFQMPYTLIADRSSLHTMVPEPTHTSAIQYFDQNQAVSIGVTENVTGPMVETWDELGLTLLWQMEAQLMRVPLVRGSPYITAEFVGATPQVSAKQSLQGNFIYVDGKKEKCDGVSLLSGSTFAFNLSESKQRWFLFAPRGSQWICRGATFSLTSKMPLHGAVRLALGSDDTAYEELLQQHAGNYPVSTSVDMNVDGDVGTVSWVWNKSVLGGWPLAPLLQLAWPVHLPLLPTSVRNSSVASVSTPFRDLRGATTAVIADSWNLTYDLFPDVGFKAPRPVRKTMEKHILNALRGSSSADSWNHTVPDNEFDLPLNYQIGAGDTYFSGKMIARLARLVVIADELGESSLPYFTTMLTRLTERIEVWLGRKSLDPFLYDVSWGGVVACGCDYDDCSGKCKPHCSNSVTPPEGCPAINGAGVNFGNAFYNDHHFHYGYFVYAAAVAAKFDPAWEQKWRQNILALIRDYGNPSTEDLSFPVVRHKDWFLGFSWAGGITEPTVNGRNQESTSEAINAYYAIYAYGSAVDEPFAKQIKDVGRLLTAMEVHGADTYWHVRSPSEIYGTNFPFNYPTVGMVWSNMVNHQTYFGMQLYYIEGIHLMPITPVMESYLKLDWVATQFPSYKKACDSDPNCLKSGFSWQVCLEQALVNIADSLACLEALPSDAFSGANPGSNGNSLTNSLHWISTRLPPSPVPPSPTPSPPSPAPPSPDHCNVGDVVNCPGTSAKCAGDQCCMDGSTCPSAEEDFKGCANRKSEDCTKHNRKESFSFV